MAAIFKFQEEIFLIQRSEALKAFPGYYAFPGGKVEPGESQELALRREIIEELKFDLTCSANVVFQKKLAQAETPEFSSYRFKTFFYLIELKKKIEFNLLSFEIQRGQWIRPISIYDEYLNDRMLMVPAIIYIVKNFIEKKDQSIFWNVNFVYNKEKEIPLIRPLYSVKMLSFSSVSHQPKKNNAFLIRDENKSILVDPAPSNKAELKKLFYTLKQYSLAGVFLTHHHLGLHCYAADIVRERNIPISMSAETLEWIELTWGQDYLRNIEIRIFSEGDYLTQSLKENIKLIGLLGYHGKMLVPMIESRKWMLIGTFFEDLKGKKDIQNQSILSLKKILNLNPRYIFSSSGMPTAGVLQMENFLKYLENT